MPDERKFDPKKDLFMGAIMVNLGYITQEQHRNAEDFDALAIQLKKNNPDFKKPFYGHIANGDQVQAIIDEYNKQVKDGTFKPDEKTKDLVGRYERGDIKFGIKGEKPDSDIEREGGPIKGCLQVQKELRKLEDLPDSPEGMRRLTREIADKHKIDHPAKTEKQSRLERALDVDGLLLRTAEASVGKKPQEHIERPIA